MKKLLSFILMMALILPSPVNGQVSFIKQGDKAPYDGFLFSPDKEAEVRQHLLEWKALDKVNASLEKSLFVETAITQKTTEKLAICNDQNDKLAKSLYSERGSSDLERIIWFSLGVIAAVGGFYAVKQASK